MKTRKFLVVSFIAALLTPLVVGLGLAQGPESGGAASAPPLAPVRAPASIVVTLHPSLDTYVDSEHPDSPYSTVASVKVGSTGDLGEAFALLKFSLSSIPAGSSITSATFSAYFRSYCDVTPVSVSVRRATASWGSTVTWNTQPGLSSSYANHSVGSSTGFYVEWPVTALVQQWWIGIYPNHGLALRSGAGQTCKWFDSINGTQDPELRIEYALPTPTPTPTPTRTKVPTKTPTSLPTATPTNTPKGISTPWRTNTPTKTHTWTPTPTRTYTPTPTATFTPTPTDTRTPARASIGGRVWNDLDRDGRIDAGEPGMTAGHVLLELDNRLIAETDIDADGYYIFRRLTPDSAYYVHMDEATLRPIGYNLTTAANPLPVTPSPGQAMDYVHFGYALPATPVTERVDLWIMGIEVNQGLQDYVFTDLGNPGNRNGFADPGTAKDLIPGKPATVRVYVSLRDSADLPPVPADGFEVGGELHVQGAAIGSARHLLNPVVNPNCKEYRTTAGQTCMDRIGVFPSLGTQGLNTNTDYDLDLVAARTQLEGTLNFVIPPELTEELSSDGVIITADVWPVRRNEINSWDNRFQLQLDNVSAPQPLAIDLVRIGGWNGDEVFTRPTSGTAQRALTQMLNLTPYSELVMDRERTFSTSFRGLVVRMLGAPIDTIGECDSLWIRLWRQYGDRVMDGHTVFGVTPVDLGLKTCGSGLGWKIPGYGGLAYAEAPPFAVSGSLIVDNNDADKVAGMVHELYHGHRDARHASNDHGEEDGCMLSGWVADLVEVSGINTDCWTPSLHPHGWMGEYPASEIWTGSGHLTGRIYGNRGAMGVRMEPEGDTWRLTLYDACPTGAIDRDHPLTWLRERWDTTDYVFACSLDDDDIPHDFMSYGENPWTSEDRFQGVTAAPAAQSAGADLPLTLAVAPSASLPPGTEQVVSGIISATGTVLFAPILPGPVSTVWALAAAPEGALATSPLTLAVQTRQGANMTVPALVAYAAASPPALVFFSARLPAGVEPVRIGAWYGGQEKGAVAASPAIPWVHVLWPNGGEVLAGGQWHTLRWEAGDADGDALSFLVEYSANGGATWQALGNTEGETSLDVPAEIGALDSSRAALLRVTVSDGLNLAWDRSDTTFAVGSGQSFLPLVTKN